MKLSSTEVVLIVVETFFVSTDKAVAIGRLIRVPNAKEGGEPVISVLEKVGAPGIITLCSMRIITRTNKASWRS